MKVVSTFRRSTVSTKYLRDHPGVTCEHRTSPTKNNQKLTPKPIMEELNYEQIYASQNPEMDDSIDNLTKKEFVSVWVRDPQVHKEDFWHTYIDYEICLHTNSMCFRKKTSCVRRRYSEFVWLRQRLQDNALLIQLPKLPTANPFFSLNSAYQVAQRMQGLQKFLEIVLQTPLLLSDSRLHLFLQSQLNIAKMEACVQGQTRYTVAQAIQRCVYETRFPAEEESKSYCDSDCESTTSSGLGSSVGPATPIEMSTQNGSPAQRFLATPTHQDQLS